MSFISYPDGHVRALGVFHQYRSEDDYRAALRLELDKLDSEDRPLIANYLREGTLVLAWMEYTRDVLGDLFGTSGGSAIRTDGTYFWRADAAEYVEHYGIAVPVSAIEHMRRNKWVPPNLSTDHVLLIDKFLSSHSDV